MGIRFPKFQKCLEETEGRKRHLLLGNGFSIRAHSPFKYKSLAAVMRRRDDTLRTVLPGDNVEAAMEGASPAVVERLRTALADAIAEAHDYRNATLSPKQIRDCGNFLGLFARGKGGDDLRGTIFTTNYDTMLDWIVVEHSQSGLLDYIEDGFPALEDSDLANLWDPRRLKQVRMFYLHGALALYHRRDRRISKLRPKDVPGKRTIDLVRKLMSQGGFPLFVSEGRTEEKYWAIRRNRYLRAAFDTFEATCGNECETLFTFGHSLSEQDDHIADAIGRGRMKQVYLGAQVESDRTWFRQRYEQWQERRDSLRLPPITVNVFWQDEVTAW